MVAWIIMMCLGLGKIAVIGGGASGIFASIAAAEAGAKVVVLEAGRKTLKKVAISGGGRVEYECGVFVDTKLRHY